MHVVGGAGGPQRGHRVGKAQLRQRHHIHIAFGDQHIALFAQGVACFKQAIEFAALAEHGRFRRVQVFGLVVAQHTPTKADALALDVADGKHDPVAEAVVALFVFAVFRFMQDHQATFHQQRVVVLREHAGQAAPPFRGIAQAKLFGHFARQAAALEIGNGAWRILEVPAVGVRCLLQHAGQRVLLFPLLLRAGAVLGGAFFLGHHHAILLGQVLDGFNEGHAHVVHQEADGVAVFAAAKAVVELLGRADRERGRLFPVERA